MSSFKDLVKRWIPPKYLIYAYALDYYLNGSQEIRALKILCDRNKTSIDVGANIGVITYFLQRHSSHVYAYEPNPKLSTRLRDMFSNKKVTVIQSAVSDQEGSSTLKIPYYDGEEMHGLASLSQEFEDSEHVEEHQVPLVRLDDENCANVGFIKIDVEQHEEAVLRGSMGLIRRNKPNLLVEVTPKLYDKTLLVFFSDILDLGYRGFFFFDKKIIPLENYDMQQHNSSKNFGASSNLYMTNVILVSDENKAKELLSYSA